jgi:hypothetical protein
MSMTLLARSASGRSSACIRAATAFGFPGTMGHRDDLRAHGKTLGGILETGAAFAPRAAGRPEQPGDMAAATLVQMFDQPRGHGRIVEHDTVMHQALARAVDQDDGKIGLHPRHFVEPCARGRQDHARHPFLLHQLQVHRLARGSSSVLHRMTRNPRS